MSKEQPTQQQLTSEQERQKMFSQLSNQYKVPLRNIMGETEEAVQTTITSMIHQMIGLNNALTNMNQQLKHLQKLCIDNKINFNSPPPNRALEKKAKKSTLMK